MRGCEIEPLRVLFMEWATRQPVYMAFATQLPVTGDFLTLDEGKYRVLSRHWDCRNDRRPLTERMTPHIALVTIFVELILQSRTTESQDGSDSHTQPGVPA